MQPSCFVTDGKEELMQTSKNHFEAKVIFNDETIRRMFRTEFYTYEGMQRLVWLAVAFALVMLALFVPIPTVVKVLCLLVGCAMFAMPDFLSRVAAEGVIMQRGGAESTVSCRINAGGGTWKTVPTFRLIRSTAWSRTTSTSTCSRAARWR